VDDPNIPNSSNDVEGVRILGAQPAGPSSDAGAPRSAPRAAATPSWDDEDDEEWGEDWAGETAAPSAEGDDASSDDWSSDDESGVWGDDETGAFAVGRAPAANTAVDDDNVRGPRWRGEADDWSDGEDLGDLDAADVKVGTLDPDRGEESELYRFRELDDDPAEEPEPVVAKAPRKAATGDGMSGRSGGRTSSRPRPTASAAVPVVPAGLGTRVITAAGLIAAFFAVVLLLGRRGATALVAAVLLMAALEFYDSLRHRGFAPAIIPGAVACFAMPLVAFGTGETGMMLVLILTVLVTMLWSLFRVVRDRPVGNMSVTLLGVGYIGVLGGTAGLLLAHPNGIGLLLGGLACTVASDVVAYFVGANLGKVPLAPEVSPNKTIEGVAGGFFGSVITGVVAFGAVGVAPWNSVVIGAILGIVVGVLAPLGDLAESMIKRDLGIKDMGAILPGHGGFLDRIDAMLFVMPGVYFIARLKNWI
jgi:phosphatidate cytidylyltransferase